MPNSKVPRKPIPKFTKAELNRANLCAEALWYGVNFKTGDLYPISDENIGLELFLILVEVIKVKRKPAH